MLVLETSFLKRYFTLIYVGECGGVITTDNNEDAPVDQMYQQMIDDYAESIEEQTTHTTSNSMVNQNDPILSIISWEVGKGKFGSWKVMADTKYGYYHTEHFSYSQMLY